MKVLVTGASGKIGSETVAQLLAAEHEVIATDVKPLRPLPVKLHEVNLLDGPGVAALMNGIEAVVHLGNHTGVHKRSSALVFNENIAMNMNVFQAALEA